MSLSQSIVNDVLSDMGDRSGFDYEAIDPKTQDEIVNALETIVNEKLDPIRAKLDALIEYAKENGGMLRSRPNFRIMANELERMLEK